ncbi:hypothetical protein CONPUDRAFT_102182 [Coniophora puteana RWD-64-598 SS2]|uniref:Gti1/Pac2 family-domain-containing protein n=1 Tax=Coniophora puteana (strain RWD-64-598) TaxID=741705 RepID=A0A5M3MW77_CONPW|nr:uncharacterized protein CONPUDRAFT_102182 [Coniophora puteana RWD-64-598 SS2]EIW83408.1 hypothetical protein CONPUDRAFT_102182 [Coniophora puteana RWD-64-598 SS2]
MQYPTATHLKVRSPHDAQVIFHAVALKVLPMVQRRLDTEERRSITSGCVFVWEERGPNAEATGLGIERWTDGKRWGPSRVRDEFLFYHEKDPEPVDGMDTDHDGATHVRSCLVKQTYSVFVETNRGRRKWHMIAYFTHDTVDYLRTIDEIPDLARISVPSGLYRSARHNPGQRRDRDLWAEPSRGPQYRPYSYPAVARQPSPPPTSSMPLIAPTPGSNSAPPSVGARENGQELAPLVYLENLAPRRRHPVDEEALMALHPPAGLS